MGELRDYYIEGLEDFVDFNHDTPCPKLPARILLDDIEKTISLNIRKGDCDCYTMEPYSINKYTILEGITMHKTSVDDALGHKKIITKEDFRELYENRPQNTRFNPGQDTESDAKIERTVEKDYCECENKENDGDCQDCPDWQACSY